MKRFILSAALAALPAAFASVVAAQEAQPYPIEQTPSTRSRAEVMAEVRAARDAGELHYGEAQLVRDEPSTAAKSRAEVIAELRAARAAGDVPYGEAPLPRVATMRARAPAATAGQVSQVSDTVQAH